VDVGVRSAKIAQSLLDPEATRLEEEPLMGGAPASGGDRESDLERHVESRSTVGELHTAEIVEGIAACRNEFENAIEPPRRTRDLQSRARPQPKRTETGDQGDEHLLVALIIGDVEKRAVGQVSLSERSGSACWPPPRGTPVSGGPLVATGESVCDDRHEFPIALPGETKRARHRRRRWVGRRDYRARSQGHVLTLRSESFSCQRAREDTVHSSSGLSLASRTRTTFTRAAKLRTPSTSA